MLEKGRPETSAGATHKNAQNSRCKWVRTASKRNSSCRIPRWMLLFWWARIWPSSLSPRRKDTSSRACFPRPAASRWPPSRCTAPRRSPASGKPEFVGCRSRRWCCWPSSTEARAWRWRWRCRWCLRRSPRAPWRSPAWCSWCTARRRSPPSAPGRTWRTRWPWAHARLGGRGWARAWSRASCTASGRCSARRTTSTGRPRWSAPPRCWPRYRRSPSRWAARRRSSPRACQRRTGPDPGSPEPRRPSVLFLREICAPVEGCLERLRSSPESSALGFPFF